MSNLESPSYILIPGAGGMAWYWHRVVALLEQAQREAIAADLPGDDESAGLDDYAEIVVREIGQRTNSTLVAQSLGAFIAAVVRERVSVGKLVFVNAMLPVPGETAGDWWENTGAIRARIAAAETAGSSFCSTPGAMLVPYPNWPRTAGQFLRKALGARITVNI